MNILFHSEKNLNLINYFNKIYGLKFNKSSLLCKDLGLDKNFKYSNLTKKDLRKINDLIFVKNKYKLESDLKKEFYDNIKFLKQLKTYKGIRHSLFLPVRGQNTKNNAKTQK